MVWTNEAFVWMRLYDADLTPRTGQVEVALGGSDPDRVAGSPAVAIHPHPLADLLVVWDEAPVVGQEVLGFDRVRGRLFDREDGTPRGEPFVIYHAFGPDSIDAEACLPVPTAVRTRENIEYRELPAVTVVETLHVGPYDELGQAYQALTEWIEDHGFEAAGPVRERYLNEPGPDVPPSAYRRQANG